MAQIVFHPPQTIVREIHHVVEKKEPKKTLLQKVKSLFKKG